MREKGFRKSLPLGGAWLRNVCGTRPLLIRGLKFEVWVDILGAN